MYTFPASLTLSSDIAIEDLLADIPIFSVGLLSFGVFTFFFAMKRVNALSVVLYAAVFFAFIASVFDLGQVLTRGRYNADNGAAGLNAVTGLIAARELLFAVSVGLRFLFFWLFVAEPPRGEAVESTPFDPIANLFTFTEKHSGAWGRWGITGIFLKLALLAVSFIIGILQIIWRVVPSDNRLGPVYDTEAAMEIIASVLFIVKLLLNSLITPVTPQSKTLRTYAAMIFALLINLGLGIGNIVIFAFTESILGRFLLAVELYIVIVFVLIFSFHNYTPKPADAKAKPTFQGVLQIKRSSTFRIPPLTDNPVLITDKSVLTSYRNHPYHDTRPERPSRSSAASRLSSWIVSRRMSRRHSVGSGDRAQLWNQDQAERGQSPVDIKTQNWKEPVATSTVNDALSGTGELCVSQCTTTTDSNSDSRHIKNVSTGDFDPVTLKLPRMPRFDSTTYSIGSYYVDGKAAPSTPPAAATFRQTESPVYGLSGIVRRTSQGRQTPNSIARTRSSVVSFTELLRQQTELDNSIAALRLLSPHEPGRDSMGPSNVISAVANLDRSKDLNRSNSSVGLPSSGLSEFSLSNFPEPPLTRTSTVVSLSSPTSTLKIGFDRSDERRSILTNAIIDLPLPRMPVLNDYPTTPQSLLDSPGRNSGDINMSGNLSRVKVNSAGTQYDVTSFIGNLTTPGFKKSPAFDRLTDIDSEDGGSEISGSVNTPQTAVIMQVPNASGSASAMRSIYINVGSALPPFSSERSSSTVMVPGGALTSPAPASIEKPMPALPAQAIRSVPGDRPAHKRNVSANILPSLPINNSSDSQSNAAQNLPAGGNVIGATEEAGVNARRRVPPAALNTIGLPTRPRLAVSGPKAPPQDGKGDQAPSAFERPRPPPLILQQASGKPPSNGGSF